MAEESTQTSATANTAMETTATDDTQSSADAAQSTDWKAEARKWEKRAKENSEAAEELKKLKESQMTEAGKAAAKTAELQAKLNEYEARDQQAQWRKAIAAEYDLPENVIFGSTEEDMKACAENLKPYFKRDAAPIVASQGVQPSTNSKKSTAELFAMAVESRKR